jgi:uncharacterized protein YjbI with pentapeptide repeats
MMLNSKSIGTKIAETRKKANLSQAELAQQVSISPQAVGKWERGESMPDITMLNKLTAIFKVDLNYFSDSFQTVEKEISTKKIKVEDGIFSKLKNNMGLNWDMSGSNWVDADFSGLKNLKEVLKGSSLKNCKFIKSEMSDILFSGNEIVKCDFSNADFRNSIFNGSEISNSLFVGSSLIDSEFVASEVSNCNFSNSDFSGLELTTSDFRKNNIENVIWKVVSFKQTQLTSIIFNGLIEDCSFDSCSFSKVIFKNVILKNTFFKNTNLKRVEFTDCHADKLTYEFLKNCKANLTGVTLT